MPLGTKIFKGVLGKLIGDTPAPKKQGALPDEDQPKEGMSRRGMLTGMAATPLVAGALSEIPVQKAVDKFEGGFKTVLNQPKFEPIIKTGSDFKSFDDELKLGSEVYTILTGEKITPKKLLERDMAEYLYYQEKGESPYLLDTAVEGTGREPVYKVLEDLSKDALQEDFPKIAPVMEKYLGKADNYQYGSVDGAELAIDLFYKENPNPKKGEFDEAIVKWLRSKGVDKTKYYKDLVKAGEKAGNRTVR